jgi:hypothetical protein
MSKSRIAIIAVAAVIAAGSAQAASFYSLGQTQHPPVRPLFLRPQPQPMSIFTAPAAGPAGAQFGRLPATNNSFIDPTRNSVNAHQTQNSVQATNTMMSSQAVQGRNCTLNAIRTGLCQGR